MTPQAQISEADIHAYVDGLLDPAQHERVAAWLADNPEMAEKVAAYRRQNEALHARFDHVLDEPLPPAIAATAAGQRGSNRSILMRVAAMLLLFLAGAASGWALRSWDAPSRQVDAMPGYVQRAVGAHAVYAAEVRHPVEVGADQEAHLVAWLSKRLGHPLRAPHLAKAGYKLVGGRLLEDEGRPAAQFMYEDGAGRRVTVYARGHQGKETAFKFSGNGTVATFYWIDAPFAYALAGEIPRQELLDLAHLVYEELMQ